MNPKIVIGALTGVSVALLSGFVIAMATHLSDGEKHETTQQKQDRVHAEMSRHYQEVIKPDLEKMEERLTSEIDKLSDEIKSK